MGLQKEMHSMKGDEIRIDEKEVYRYLGYAGSEPDQTMKELVAQCAKEMAHVATPKSLYQILNAQISLDNQALQLGFATVQSKDLAKNLARCKKIVLIGATIGPRPDLLIQKYSRLDPLKGVTMQAVGAMLVESYLDDRNEVLRERMWEQGYRLHPRFSPGYGDFSLEHQRDIFRMLDCGSALGLTLMDSMIMAPSKSVTAVIGMEPLTQEECGQSYEQKHTSQTDRCATCTNTDCPFKV